jgi:hypothetical protein
MDKKILQIIENRNKDYDKNAQRAELLVRNDIFLKELNKIQKIIGREFHQVKSLSEKKLNEISKSNILLKLNYPGGNIASKEEILNFIDKMINDFNLREFRHPIYKYINKRSFKNEFEKNIFYKNIKLKAYFLIWRRFCKRWHIKEGWDGGLSKIKRYQEPPTKILLKDQFEPIPPALPIVICVGPWTSRDDIKKIWPKIEKIQKTKFYKEGRSSVFSRDLCWYDLNKDFKLKPREITDLWNEKYPKDIDKLAMKEIKRQNIELAEEDELELLEEITNDPSMAEQKKQFEEYREWYITGQTERGRFNPPFTDVIKKAIKRFKERIHVLDPPSSNDI